MRGSAGVRGFVSARLLGGDTMAGFIEKDRHELVGTPPEEGIKDHHLPMRRYVVRLALLSTNMDPDAEKPGTMSDADSIMPRARRAVYSNVKVYLGHRVEGASSMSTVATCRAARLLRVARRTGSNNAGWSTSETLRAP